MHRDLDVFWRNAHPKLKELDLRTFTHMRVCCPQCGGNPEGCKWCNGTGLCCPRCRGAGWLADRHKGGASDLVRCNTCYLDMSDGAQYDSVSAMRAIDRYLEDWFDGVLADEVTAHQEAMAEIAKEASVNRQHGGKLWKHG